MGKEFDLWQAELQRVIAEHIGNLRIDVGLLPVHDVAAARGFQPVSDVRRIMHGAGHITR